MDVGAEDIRRWHVEGNGWDDIGYHYVIRRDGSIEKGRDDNVQGAHVRGHNKNSLGVCMVGGYNGECNYTSAQWLSLESIISTLKVQHKNATVHGHNEFSDKKCPCFDVKSWSETL